MKGKIALIFCLLILSLLMIALVAPAIAIDGDPSFSWVDPDYSGVDPYYRSPLDGSITIVGYLTGTYWNLTIMWTNDRMYPVNVSAIRTYFSWGKNYTFAFTDPIRIDPGMTQIFSVYNVTPPLTEAPEQLAPYSYAIYIHHVNSTTPPYQERTPIDPSLGGYGFVALSADHLACLNYWAKYGMLYDGVGGPLVVAQPQIYPTIPIVALFYTNITEVQVLLTQALFEFNLGFEVYMTGVFSTARQHLENGDELINDALAAWSERGNSMEEAALNYQNAQANYYGGMGSYYSDLGEASKTNAYGWVLFGLGWVFIGVGVIVYGARKPKGVAPHAAAPQA